MKIRNSLPRQVRDQQQLAIAQQSSANHAAQQFRLRLEKQFGFPVVVQQLGASSGAGGTVRSYWDQRTPMKCHSIQLAASAPWSRPHGFAHELMHICLEAEANAAGQRRTAFQSPETQRRLAACCDPARPQDREVLQAITSYARNAAADLVVESRLHRELPELRPAQFVNLHAYEDRTAQQHLNSRQWDISPNLRLAFDSLIAVRSKLVDHLAPTRSPRFARFESTPAGQLADKLFTKFLDRFERGLLPGEHYALMDSFAQTIGLPGLNDWSAKTAFELLAPAISISPE